MNNSRLVYSTTGNNTCPHCRKPRKNCTCQGQTKSGAPQDGVVRISRETKGRKGKGVTLVSGVALSEPDLKVLAKELKTLCGSGGSIKDGVIELQGDHRTQVQTFLEQRLQQKIKLAGG